MKLVSQFYYATITGKARWKHRQAWISAKFNENLPPKQIGQAEAFGDIFKSIQLKFLADVGDQVVYGRITYDGRARAMLQQHKFKYFVLRRLLLVVWFKMWHQNIEEFSQGKINEVGDFIEEISRMKVTNRA